MTKYDEALEAIEKVSLLEKFFLTMITHPGKSEVVGLPSAINDYVSVEIRVKEAETPSGVTLVTELAPEDRSRLRDMLDAAVDAALADIGKAGVDCLKEDKKIAIQAAKEEAKAVLAQMEEAEKG